MKRKFCKNIKFLHMTSFIVVGVHVPKTKKKVLFMIIIKTLCTYTFCFNQCSTIKKHKKNKKNEKK